MKVIFPARVLAALAASFLVNQFATAQATTNQLFGPIFTRSSPSGATGETPAAFGTTTVSLTCPSGSTANIMGLASEGNPSANLLVDNNIFVTVSQGSYTNGPQNVCPAADGFSCFAPAWVGNYPNFLNQNPDNFAAANGIAPVDISTWLSNPDFDLTKPLTVNFALEDEGVVLASTSLFLTTTCTFNGVSSGTVGGNPITGSQNQGTAQTFTFNSNTGNQKGVQFGYDITGAATAGDLGQNEDGSIPQVSDTPVDASKFQSVYVPGTSFATSNCIVHSGEVLADGITHACKIYTLQCMNPTNGTVAGANCPMSNEVNEAVNDLFDGPPIQLYDIHNKNGGVIHEGMGFLMASDSWPGTGVLPSNTNCQFDPLSGINIANSPCPLNLLTSFTGPGAFSGTGLTENPNSEFISVYGVPLDKTIVTVVGEEDGHWVNKSTPTIKFDVQAPNLVPASGGYPYIVVNGVKKPVPGASNYVPQPIKNVSYGITTALAVPNPINEPISNDVMVVNAGANCMYGALGVSTQPDFIKSDTVSSGAALSDGQYVLHYYAQDCAGTQELNFTMAPGTGVWSTNFFTRPINIDTMKPMVAIVSPTGTPSYLKGATAYVSYYCTDAGFVPGGPNTGSGVTKCGTHSFGVGSNFNTGTLQTKLDTSTKGSKTYKINVQDGADNESSVTLQYTVN